MEIVCGLCLDQLGAVPHVELLCHHFYHTACFFLHRHNDTCLICQEEQLEDHQQQETVEDGARISTLYDTNEKVRTLVKNYKESYREARRVRRQFIGLLKRKKEDLDGVIQPLITQMKTLHRQKKQEVLNSQEYRTYHSKQLRCRNFLHRLQKDYQITGNSLYYLRTKRGMRGLQRIRYSTDASYMIRRKLRVTAYFR